MVIDGLISALLGRRVLAADFVDAKFDASPKNGGGPSESELDMGGFLVQGGVQF